MKYNMNEYDSEYYSRRAALHFIWLRIKIDIQNKFWSSLHLCRHQFQDCECPVHWYRINPLSNQGMERARNRDHNDWGQGS